VKFDLKSKFKKLISKKHSKKIIALIVIVIIAGGYFGSKAVSSSKNKVTQNTAKAVKGDLNVMVTGSGAIYSSNEKKLYSKIGATVSSVNYKAGDVVKAGDVIMSFDDSYDEGSSLNVKAPFKGVVTGITVNDGENVQSNATVLTISDTSKFKLQLTYNAVDAAKIAVGQTANVYLTSFMDSVSGTVTYVSNYATSTTSGGLVKSVEIRVNNPGALSSGISASADINTSSGVVSSTSTGELKYISQRTVTSSTGGTVQNVLVHENQLVSSGQLLMIMKNDKYTVVAPFDGTLTAVNYKVGDTVTAGAEVADIANPDQMQFDVNVDELDISSIALGQTVNITLDAISSTSTTPMVGEVTKIAFTGTSSSGVTTYPVTVQINGDVSKLKSGMNANAEIITSSLQGVLYVPIEAVTTTGSKSYVWVKQNTGSNSASVQTTSAQAGISGSSNKTQNSYYTGAVRKEVTIDNNTDTYIVIASGLSEGDIVVLPQTTASSSSSTKTSTNGMSTGRISSGGMSSGGGPGGM